MIRLSSPRPRPHTKGKGRQWRGLYRPKGELGNPTRCSPWPVIFGGSQSVWAISDVFALEQRRSGWLPGQDSNLQHFG